MPYARNGILGTIAVGITFGAVQIASGEGLSHRLLTATAIASHDAVDGVNRAAKADRAAPAVVTSEATRTLSFHVDRLPATSVVVRVPAQEARGGRTPPAPAAAPIVINKEQRKPMMACEPVVSVLSEIAKQLQPGRCVT
ncbi:MAG: hypothetical protein JOY90_29965 [Bradyrhizobium sp.]|uniref:hypothetical protein n=1 Tax=Bradyrhizobium sp. TaxID=376 RepID=UPI001D5DAB53|nr:hypothetical protein [Bradyrhizobium sp.]MBV9564639.1 hypothetical protein [Bradyrhizobium sp.]